MKCIVLGVLSVSAIGFAQTSPNPTDLLGATIVNLPSCATNCVGNLTGAGLAAVCANLAGYDATFNACVTSVRGCSASGSMIVIQAEALLPVIHTACVTSLTASAFSSATLATASNPATVYSNQLSQRKTVAYFMNNSDTTVLQQADLAHIDILIYAFIHVDANWGYSFGNTSLTNLHFALAQRVMFPNLKRIPFLTPPDNSSNELPIAPNTGQLPEY
ncbi:hypothetical protein HDU98_008772 [Podochytrium sp. JEL0797]|nr:hypothetical protein HDU98_008772 [Podochytrium sp. JEL0797]